MFGGEAGNRDLDSFSQNWLGIIERPVDGIDQPSIL
jgi:hypothetical protein